MAVEHRLTVENLAAAVYARPSLHEAYAIAGVDAAPPASRPPNVRCGVVKASIELPDLAGGATPGPGRVAASDQPAGVDAHCAGTLRSSDSSS